MSMTRKDFLNYSALAAASLITPSFMTNSKNYTLGLGLFSVPRGLNDDLTGTLDMLASIGFRELEVFGPYSFSDEKTKQQWGAASQMLGFNSSGFYGHTPEDFSAMVQDRGMRIPSMHTDIETLQHNMSALGEAARKIGATYVVLPSLPEDYRTDIAAYKRSADLFNEIGKKYNTLYDSFAGAPFDATTDDLVVGIDNSKGAFIRPVAQQSETGGTFNAQADDQFAQRSEKVGFFGKIEEGRVCLDARAVVGLTLEA